MKEFNPEKKEELTYGECLGPAMEIIESKDAEQYFIKYVAWIQRALDKEPRNDSITASDIAKCNLGYYAGYYSNEVRERVERLFNCSHPVFGSIKNGIPTAKEAFELGKKF